MIRVVAGILCSATCFLALVPAAQADEVRLSTNPKCEADRPPWIDFSLRSDFNDLSPLVCPGDAIVRAQGASMSLTDNIYARQYSASIDGLAALAVRYFGESNSTVGGVALGAFVQGDGTHQFNAPASQNPNSDSITYGLFTQVVFHNDWVRTNLGAAGAIDIFRFRGGEVTGSSGTTSTTFVGEWIPSYSFTKPFSFGDALRLDGTPLWYVLSPELMVQYDRYESGPNKFLLFASNNQALRVGPQIVLQLFFDKASLPSYLSPGFRDFLLATTALITSHTSVDVYTGKEYSWNAVSITHNLSPNFGVSASFGSGNSEATGNNSRQAKLGLSAKF